MNNRTRIKMFFGLVAVGLVCAGLVTYVNYTNSRVFAKEAHIKTNTRTVGTDYSGQITKQFVETGDKVAVGDPIYYIKSPTLNQAINGNVLTKKDLHFEMTTENELIVASPVAGYVGYTEYNEGSYVRASTDLVTITNGDAATVTAVFEMSKAQYAAVSVGEDFTVQLPSDKSLAARISEISVTGQGVPLLVTITGTIDHAGDEIAQTRQQNLPISAKLTVHEDNYWNTLSGWVKHRFADIF